MGSWVREGTKKEIRLNLGLNEQLRLGEAVRKERAFKTDGTK